MALQCMSTHGRVLAELHRRQVGVPRRLQHVSAPWRKRHTHGSEHTDARKKQADCLLQWLTVVAQTP